MLSGAVRQAQPAAGFNHLVSSRFIALDCSLPDYKQFATESGVVREAPLHFPTNHIASVLSAASPLGLRRLQNLAPPTGLNK
jgi:hypothetical protein